jgi:hypothetical protein
MGKSGLVFERKGALLALASKPMLKPSSDEPWRGLTAADGIKGSLEGWESVIDPALAAKSFKEAEMAASSSPTARKPLGTAEQLKMNEEFHAKIGQALVDNLNRNVLADSAKKP